MTSRDVVAPGRVIADVAANIREPRIRRFYDYWLGKRGGRRMPARGDIDPLDFPYVLGDLVLVDVLSDPQRFRVRLHGSNLVARMRYDMTGRLYDELPHPEWRAYMLDRCRGLVASGDPLLVRNDLYLDGWGSPYEALWLPFSDDGVNVTLLVCAMIYGELGPAAVPG